MKDAVAYMAWERVVPWKILSMMARPNAPLVPLGFGARNRDFYELLKSGSRIWVVTRIANEFSLAGRLTVMDILDRNCIPQGKWPKGTAGLFAKWRFVARADPENSEFFETNNAGPVMAKHRIRFAQNRTIAYRDPSINNSFKSCTQQARKTVFLSYRWQEGRRFAIALAREFRKKGFSPWLDALSVPAYEAKRDPGVKAPRLKKLVKLGIEKSKFAVVINTATFARTSWTRIELGHIRRKDIPWFQVMRGGTERKCVEPPILSRKPEVVVQEILKRRGMLV
jgi:TIR domain